MNLSPQELAGMVARGAVVTPKPVRYQEAGMVAPYPEAALMKAKRVCEKRTPLPQSVPCQSLWIPNWTPGLLNQIMRGHWSNGAKIKRADKDIVAFYFSQAGISKATGPRRVSLVFILPKKKRMFDRDAPWKSCKDALAACGALLDDTPRLCIDGPVSYARAIGAESAVGTMILLEDL